MRRFSTSAHRCSRRPRLAVSGRPVVNLSLAVNYAMNDAFGVDQSATGSSATLVYHVTNLLLHVLCGLLLFGVIRRTLSLEQLGEWANANADMLGLVATAFWLLHPIQTEAVDYVIQRTELLVSLCYLATLYASIRGWDASTPVRRARWLVVGVVACFIGMASKEVMVTAPAVVVLYDRVFRVSSWRALFADRARRWFYGGLAASWLLLAALVAGGGRADSAGFTLGLPWYRYLYSQGWAIAHYLLLMVWPSDLRFDYGLRPITGIGGLVGGAIILALAVPALVVALRTKRWWAAFLILWFFAILAPSSSILPIQTEIAAERRVYLASAALIVAAVVAAAYALRANRRLVLSGAAVIALVLFGLTMRRSALYADTEALWRDAVAKAPENPRAYDNLASVIYQKDRGRINEADSLWTRALAIDSTYMTAWSNLAQIRMDKGRVADARVLLERAVRINPDYVDATRRLGALLAVQGDTNSIAYLERMANSAQVTDESLVALAQSYLNANRPDDAIAALRRALTLNPRRTDAASFLGAMLAQRGRFDEAMPLLERGVEWRSQRHDLRHSQLWVRPAGACRRRRADGAAGRGPWRHGRRGLPYDRPRDAADWAARGGGDVPDPGDQGQAERPGGHYPARHRQSRPRRHACGGQSVQAGIEDRARLPAGGPSARQSRREVTAERVGTDGQP